MLTFAWGKSTGSLQPWFICSSESSSLLSSLSLMLLSGCCFIYQENVAPLVLISYCLWKEVTSDPFWHRSDSECKTVFCSCGMFVWLIHKLLWPLTFEPLGINPRWCQQIKLINYYIYLVHLLISDSQNSLTILKLLFIILFVTILQEHFWANWFTFTSENLFHCSGLLVSLNYFQGDI